MLFDYPLLWTVQCIQHVFLPFLSIAISPCPRRKKTRSWKNECCRKAASLLLVTSSVEFT